MSAPASDAAEAAERGGPAGQIPYKRGMTLREIMEAEDGPDFDISEDMERECSPQRKEPTMAVLNNDPNRYPNTPKAERVSPFDDLITAVGAMRELQGRASELADKIAGSMPRGVSETKDKRGASGLVDVVEIAVENIREIRAGINDDLQRIERRL